MMAKMFGLGDKISENSISSSEEDDVHFDFEQELKNENLDMLNADTGAFLSGQENFSSENLSFDATLDDNLGSNPSDIFEMPLNSSLTGDEVSALPLDKEEPVAMNLEDTPSFINEWKETPKEDDNGDWKAPQQDIVDLDETDVLSGENSSEQSFDYSRDYDDVATEDDIVEDGSEQELIVEDPSEIQFPENDIVQEGISEKMADDEPFMSETFSDNNISEEVSDENVALDSVSDFMNSGGENDFVVPADTNEIVSPSARENYHDAGYAKWFSGVSDDHYFEVDRQMQSYVIEGRDDCRAVHINCGLDTYGWLVFFDNGMAMSLSDVREYQLRNGNLPDKNGVIRYGGNEFVFREIERIVIYKSVQYFSYGV